MENQISQIFSTHGYKTEKTDAEDVNFQLALKAYSKQGYMLDDEMITLLKSVFNKQIKYRPDNDTDILDFRTSKVLKDYPRLVIQSYERKFNLTHLIPLAEIHNGYMVIVKDQQEKVYGIYDNLVLLFGKTIPDGIDNILKNKVLKTLSE